MMKILNVVGARPNFMKMAPIIAALDRRGDKVSQVLVHTGQHYDETMSAAFFRDLGMPRPQIEMNTRPGTQTEQTARIMLAFESVLIAQQPDWVVVVGDVNSTLACAMVASKLCVRVAARDAILEDDVVGVPLGSKSVSVPEVIGSKGLLRVTHGAATEHHVMHVA